MSELDGASEPGESADGCLATAALVLAKRGLASSAAPAPTSAAPRGATVVLGVLGLVVGFLTVVAVLLAAPDLRPATSRPVSLMRAGLRCARDPGGSRSVRGVPAAGQAQGNRVASSVVRP